MSPFKYIISLVVIAPLLGACVGSYKTWGNYHSPSYSPQQFGYFNQNKDLETIVFGNPFKEDKQKLEKRVTDAMQGRNAGGSTHFTTTPDATNDPATYFIIQFNPDMKLSSDSLCSRKKELAYLEPATGSVNMIMAYCQNNKAISYLKGSANAVSSSDENFTNMIGRSVQVLIPIKNPNDKGNNCKKRTGC